MKAEESRKSRQKSLMNRFGKHEHIALKCFIVILGKYTNASALNRFGKHVHIAVLKCFIVIMKVHKRIKRVFESSDEDSPTQ